jgi:hypothetical protein
VSKVHEIDPLRQSEIAQILAQKSNVPILCPAPRFGEHFDRPVHAVENIAVPAEPGEKPAGAAADVRGGVEADVVAPPAQLEVSLDQRGYGVTHNAIVKQSERLIRRNLVDDRRCFHGRLPLRRAPSGAAEASNCFPSLANLERLTCRG